MATPPVGGAKWATARYWRGAARPEPATVDDNEPERRKTSVGGANGVGGRTLSRLIDGSITCRAVIGRVMDGGFVIDVARISRFVDDFRRISLRRRPALTTRYLMTSSSTSHYGR